MLNKQRQKRLDKLNKIMRMLPTFDPKVGNKTRAERLKLTEPTYYAMRKTLRQLHRIDKNDRPINSRPITETEYVKVGFPYKSQWKKLGKKKVARIVKGSRKKANGKSETDAIYLPKGEGKAYPTLPEPEDFPVMESEPTITLTGTPNGLASFINKLK